MTEITNLDKLDLIFLSSIIDKGKSGLLELDDFKIQPEELTESASKVLRYIRKYYANFKDVPNRLIIEEEIGETLPNDSISIQYYIQKILDRRFITKMTSTLQSIPSGERDAAKLFEKIDIIQKSRQLYENRKSVVLMSDTFPAARAFYEKIERGERGIQTRWAGVNAATMGFWPQDLILFVARLNTGKSWMAILLAHDAWKNSGKRVLFVSTEMAQIAVTMRFEAIQLGLPYPQMREATLSPWQKEKYSQNVEETTDNFYTIEAGFDYSINGLSLVIEEIKPDVIVVDGAYLIRGRGNTRFEQAAAVFEDLKRLAMQTKTTIIATTQLNRSANASQKETVSASTIALSDNAGWVSDCAFALLQTEDMKFNKKMHIKPLKIREGKANPIEINWDFSSMDFSEVDSQDPNIPMSGDADDSSENNF